jgi:hypothetical protein
MATFKTILPKQDVTVLSLKSVLSLTRLKLPTGYLKTGVQINRRCWNLFLHYHDHNSTQPFPTHNSPILLVAGTLSQGVMWSKPELEFSASINRALVPVLPRNWRVTTRYSEATRPGGGGACWVLQGSSSCKTSFILVIGFQAKEVLRFKKQQNLFLHINKAKLIPLLSINMSTLSQVLVCYGLCASLSTMP